jgi:hypothetical protein
MVAGSAAGPALLTLCRPGSPGRRCTASSREPLDKIRAEQLAPDSTGIRILVQDTRQPWAFPAAPAPAPGARVPPAGRATLRRSREFDRLEIRYFFEVYKGAGARQGSGDLCLGGPGGRPQRDRGVPAARSAGHQGGSGEPAGQETPALGVSLEAVSRKLLLVFCFKCRLGRHQETAASPAPCLRLALLAGASSLRERRHEIPPARPARQHRLRRAEV